MRARPLVFASLLAVTVLGCARSHGRATPEERPRLDAAVMRDARPAGADASRADAHVPRSDSGPLCIPEIEVCDGLDQDCDALVDESTDALCTFAHASGGCVDGACRLLSCDPGFADCDGEDGNGCEVDLASDRAYCGACGIECRVSEACVAGVCEREEIVDLAYSRGSYFGCVVLASGRLVCWGRNEIGTIASGTTADQLVPREVDGIDDVAHCAIAAAMLCAVRSDGRVWCRGGADGIGIVPEWREVTGLANVVEVRAGHHHFCAREDGGRVACWGKHLFGGRLGVGADGPMDTWDPVMPLGLPPATVISTDDLNACAVDEHGVVRCWGWLFVRSLNPRRPVEEYVPFEVPQEHGAVWLSHARSHSCFIASDGALRCWGYDPWGAWLTDPVVLLAVGPARRVWVSAFLNAALSRDGRVFWWGRDLTQPFDMLARPARATPQHVPGFDGATRMVMGEMSICAQLGPSSVRCMGWNSNGALGDGTYETRPEPVALVGFE